MRSQLWSLTFGNFAIGTGVLIMPGMIDQLAVGLSSTLAEIGMMYSIFALVICVTGPVLASLTSAINRRALLTAALALYAVTHLLSACAPDYASLLALRTVTALGAAVFTAQAAATAGLLVPLEQRGRAIGLALLGWSIASVLGMPVGSFLGAQIGWRWTLAAEGMLAAVGAAWIWWQIPDKLYVAPLNRAAWKALFNNRPLLLVLTATALQGTGQFILFSYLVIVWKAFIQASPLMISLLFACFGISGVVGNLLGAQVMDRLGTERIALIALVIVCIALVLWPLSRGSLVITVLLTLLWGLGCFIINGAQQARLVQLAPALASASIAMNSSAMYLGHACGAFIGGIFITYYGATNYLSSMAAVFVGFAIVSSCLTGKLIRHRFLETPA